MAKVRKLSNSDGTHYGWFFHCPGCEYGHVFDERWTFNGDADKPTFSPSLLVYESPNGHTPRCHSFVRDGKIEFLNDCGHELKGQTVELPDLED